MRHPDLVILDGGTGSEVEQRIQVTQAGWIYRAAIDHPEVVEEVHKNYIKAGSDIIITNTFSVNGTALEPLGELDILKPSIEAAIAIARKSCMSSKCNVVGSIGMYTPKRPGAESSDGAAAWPTDESAELILWEQTVQPFIDNRVPVIYLEMARDYKHVGLLLKTLGKVSKAESYWPKVYIGVSITQASEIHGHDEDMANDLVFLTHSIAASEDRFRKFDANSIHNYLKICETEGINLAGFHVMHTPSKYIMRALKVIREDAGYKGELGAYPDFGVWDCIHYKSDAAGVDSLIPFFKEWVEYGVKFIGGCCGTGPDLIERLVKEFR